MQSDPHTRRPGNKPPTPEEIAPSPRNRKTLPPRDILHVDIDAFFASVEKILDPSLNGKAVIVGGDVNDRSVVSSASYEARRYGVRSAMPIAQARRLCPGAIFLRGNFEAYARFSDRVLNILNRFTPIIERTSLDDFYLDLTGCRRLHGHPFQAADKIKRTVRNETGLPVSIGVASNKLVAKIASGLAKPDGILRVDPGNEAAFLRHLHMKKLPGIGAAAAASLRKFNLATLGEIASISADALERAFGAWGRILRERAQGIDDSPVVPDRGLPKSISHEHTFARDTMDADEIRAVLYTLTERTARRLRDKELLARTVTVKLRYTDFKTSTAARRLAEPTDMDHHLYEAALDRLEHLMLRRIRVRLVGVALSGLIPGARRQGALFDQRAHERKRRLYAGLDRIRRRHGFHILSPAAALRRKE